MTYKLHHITSTGHITPVPVIVENITYLQFAQHLFEFFDILSCLIKIVLFSGSIALIACYKAFRCRPGAAGVGRACTEAFVASCMVILAQDFFLNVLLNTVY